MTIITTEQAQKLLDEATPGPWRSDDAAVRLDDKSLIALVYGNGRGSFMSNNRLFAAAPDLARALLDARAELSATQTQLGDWIVRADEANVKVEKLEAELAAAKQREAELLAALEDPLVVHLNMVAGKIAKPLPSQLAHIYGEDVIRAALAQTPTDPGDGWTWNERLGWIGPDGKPAARGGA